MGDAAWKQFERDVAEDFGVLRKEGSGSMNRTDGLKADMYHPAIFNEAKHRKTFKPVCLACKKAYEEYRKDDGIGCLLTGPSKPGELDDVLIIYSKSFWRLVNMFVNDPRLDFSEPGVLAKHADVTHISRGKYRGSINLLAETEELAEE